MGRFEKNKLAGTLLCILLVLSAVDAKATAIRLNSGFTDNTLVANDDGSTGFVQFGFTMNFFGTIRTGGWVNNNGNVTLDARLSNFTAFLLLPHPRKFWHPFSPTWIPATGGWLPM